VWPVIFVVDDDGCIGGGHDAGEGEKAEQETEEEVSLKPTDSAHPF
jgi:hypothetical protein